MRSRFAVLSLSLSLSLVGCGHSEDAWQAQLAKYNQLSHQDDQERSARAAGKQALDEQMQLVEQLKDQLQKMGVDLSSLNQQLEQTGSQNKTLAKNLEEVNQALKEYQARAAQLEAIKQRFEVLRDKLKKLTDLGLKVEIRRNRMVIRLPGDVLFGSGDDKLRPAGTKVLDAVADVIRNDKQLSGRYFQIAGHTDNKPLKGGRFGDNWGLSAMRAREVLLYLIAPLPVPGAKDTKDAGGGLNQDRLHVAGYGDTDPVDKNDTDAGRQQNRRVELVLMPDIEEMLDLKSLI
ncbi:MAG: flagellar motor protein MotB [Polyangiaceae bacterium]